MSEFDDTLLPSIPNIIRTHKLIAHKSLGQHYLIEKNILKKILSSANISKDDVILEIGPGPGALTRHLLKSSAKKVYVIEKDVRFLPAMKILKEAVGERLQIIHGDALCISPETLQHTPVKIVSNLPYNVGTQLILNWLDVWPHIRSMTVMLQKEVVDRLRATPNTKIYGRLSVLAQWVCSVQKSFDVPPTAFMPPPKVLSSVVQLVPYAQYLYPCPKKKMESVTHAAFGQRRKMLRSSLKKLDRNIISILAQLNIPSTCRAENLTIEDFCRIASAL